jgi:hypothetical protein
MRAIDKIRRLPFRVQPVSHIVKRHRRKREAEEQHFKNVLSDAVGEESSERGS